MAISVFTWAFYYVALTPQTQQIDLANQYCLEEKQKLQVVEAFVLAHPNMDQYESDLENRLRQVDKMLPNSMDIAGFIVQLEEFAYKSSIQLLTIKPGQVTTKSGYQEIPVELHIKGDYFHLLDFLQNVENNKRFTAISKMSLRAQGAILEANLTVVIFSLDR